MLLPAILMRLSTIQAKVLLPHRSLKIVNIIVLLQNRVSPVEKFILVQLNSTRLTNQSFVFPVIRYR